MGYRTKPRPGTPRKPGRARHGDPLEVRRSKSAGYGQPLLEPAGTAPSWFAAPDEATGKVDRSWSAGGGQRGDVTGDNYGRYQTPNMVRWLARHPRYVLHFTPTSGCWVIQVER